MPLCPLPDVLPVPEPGPRPRRFRLRCEPGAATRLCKPIFSLLATSVLLLDGRHLHQVAHSLDLTAQRRRILLHDDVLMVPEADCLQRLAHHGRLADATAHLLDAHLALGRRLLLRGRTRTARAVPDECSRHGPPPCSSRATDSRSTRAPRHAHAPPAPPSLGSAAPPSPPAPCCADSSTRGSS